MQRAWGREPVVHGVVCGLRSQSRWGGIFAPRRAGAWMRLGKRQAWQGHVATVWRWPDRGETLRHPVDKAQEGAPL